MVSIEVVGVVVLTGDEGIETRVEVQCEYR